MWHQQPRNGQHDFLKFLQLASELLTVLVELLQRFIAIHEVMI
jgi:hypothetical protein